MSESQIVSAVKEEFIKRGYGEREGMKPDDSVIFDQAPEYDDRIGSWLVQFGIAKPKPATFFAVVRCNLDMEFSVDR